MTLGAKETEQSRCELIAEWRARHTDMDDIDYQDAMRELREYLRLAWIVYRQKHPDLDIPDTL